MRKTQCIKRAILIMSITVLIVLAVYNAVCSDVPSFWETSFTTIATLLIALVFSYFFIQKNEEDRIRKKILLDLLEKTQSLVNDERLYTISVDTQATFLKMKKRELNNKVTLLTEYASVFGIEKEITTISERVQEYASIIGDHCNDMEYLSKIPLELKRPLDIIDKEIDKAMMGVFN